MRLSNPQPARRAISLTPLIDVVFLLLVFFMLASTFMKYASVPISAAGHGSVSVPTDPRSVALIYIAPHGRLTVNGRALTSAELPAHLARLEAGGVTDVVIALRPNATVADLASNVAVIRRLPFKSIRVVN